MAVRRPAETPGRWTSAAHGSGPAQDSHLLPWPSVIGQGYYSTGKSGCQIFPMKKQAEGRPPPVPRYLARVSDHFDLHLRAGRQRLDGERRPRRKGLAV